MSDERGTKRLEDRIAEVRRGVRRIEDHLAERERFWSRVTDRAVLLGGLVVAVVAAVTLADRRQSLRVRPR